MSASESQEINETIGRVFTETLGGRASLTEVFREMVDTMPEHLVHYLVATGLKTKIRGYFTKQNFDGLPQAPEANVDGVHVQLALLDVDEYRYIIVRQLNSSRASHAQAVKLAALCAEVHGVTIALDQLVESA